MQKISSFNVHFWDTVNFKVPWPDWPRPFLTMPTQKKLSSTFNICEFVSTCKKSSYYINLFRRYGWLKNPSIWLAENTLAISQKPKFCQIWDLCRNTANNINFHYRTNSVKINDKNFPWIQKTLSSVHFWSIFPILFGFFWVFFFFEKSGVATHNFRWISSTMPKFRKN